MNGLVEWIIFLALSGIAIVTAAGMLLTMSMYRAGLALMASFVALAGLFILLNADLLAAIQVMMNVGGMLAMVLFMVMIMMDPGGEMMWGMKRDMHMRGLAAFSMHMPRGKPPEEHPSSEKEDQGTSQVSDWTCPMHPEVRQDQPGNCPKCGMILIPVEEQEPVQEQVNKTQTYTCPMHPEVLQDHPGSCPKCGMTLIRVQDASEAHESGGHEGMSMSSMSMEHSGENSHTMHMEHSGGGSGNAGHTMPMNQSASDGGSHSMSMSDHEMSMHSMSGGGHDMNTSNMSHDDMNMFGMTPRQYYDMMVDMAMSTAQLPWALVLGAVSAILLIVLVVLTPWPLSQVGPTQDATTMVGELLLSRYMIGFEGAAFLILAGIAGAVLLAKREQVPMQQAQAQQSAAEDAGKQIYTCPMHPEVRELRSGTCPKCGMTLLPAEESVASSNQSKQGEHS